MCHMKRARQFAHQNTKIKERFVDFLAKTGNKAARDYAADVMFDAMRYTVDSSGKPDSLHLDPNTPTPSRNS